MFNEAMRDFDTRTRRPDKIYYYYTMKYVARAALLDFRMMYQQDEQSEPSVLRVSVSNVDESVLEQDHDQDQKMDADANANAYAPVLRDEMVVIIIELKAASKLQQGASHRAAEAQIVERVQSLDDEQKARRRLSTSSVRLVPHASFTPLPTTEYLTSWTLSRISKTIISPIGPNGTSKCIRGRVPRRYERCCGPSSRRMARYRRGTEKGCWYVLMRLSLLHSRTCIVVFVAGKDY